MYLRNTSQLSGKSNVIELPMTEKEFALAHEQWVQGEHINTAFSTLNADQREFIMTGITIDEWNEMSANNEDE